MDDHKASVTVTDNKVKSTGKLINTSKTFDNNTMEKVVPKATETIESIWDHKDRFTRLESLTLMLTNACNLSCDYCFEQHAKDHGKSTPNSIRQAWDFLLKINNIKMPYDQLKHIRFLGGEPLLHKDLILDFMRQNKDELYKRQNEQTLNFTTNGLLLTDEFIDEYFSYPETMILMSIDTIDAKLDNRKLSQKSIDVILDNVEKIANKINKPYRLGIRSTISPQQAPHIKEFWRELHNRGARWLSFHPLILSLGEGYMEWDEKLWRTFEEDMKEILITTPEDINFVVAEGVGEKGKTNCITNNTELAVDATGDFSGCAFFTNRKDGLFEDIMMGNIFDENVFVDRYTKYDNEYTQMYVENEVCKTCDYLDMCYQCPAGNLATGGNLFRPDGMCKRFIKLKHDFGLLTTQKSATLEALRLIGKYKVTGDSIKNELLVECLESYFDVNLSKQNHLLTISPDQMLSFFYNTVFDGRTFNENTLINDINTSNSQITAKEFYTKMLVKFNIADKINIERLCPTDINFSYLCMIKILIKFYYITDNFVPKRNVV